MTKLKFEKIPFLATLVIFICSLIIIISPLRPQITSVTPELKTNQDWLTYKNDQYGFEFQYPKNWYLLEETNFGLFLSNKPYDSVSNEVVPQEGQIFIKVFYFSSAFENGLGITESENGVVTDTKLINNDNTIGVEVEYLKSDSVIQEEKITISQIISSFKFTSDATTWKTYKNDEFGFSLEYPTSLFSIPTKNDSTIIFGSNNDYTSLDFLDFAVQKISYEKYQQTHSRKLEGGDATTLLSKQWIQDDQIYTLYFGGHNEDVITKNKKDLDRIISSFKITPGISNLLTYKNEQYGFEFQYPSNFIVENPQYKSALLNYDNEDLIILKQEKYISAGQPIEIRINILSKEIGYEEVINRLSNLTDDTSDPRYSPDLGATRLINKTQSITNGISYYLLDRFEMNFAPHPYRHEYIYQNNQNIFVLQTISDEDSIEPKILDQIFSTFKFTQP